jgi:hypothetical protein
MPDNGLSIMNEPWMCPRHVRGSGNVVQSSDRGNCHFCATGALKLANSQRGLSHLPPRLARHERDFPMRLFILALCLAAGRALVATETRRINGLALDAYPSSLIHIGQGLLSSHSKMQVAERSLQTAALNVHERLGRHGS